MRKGERRKDKMSKEERRKGEDEDGGKEERRKGENVHGEEMRQKVRRRGGKQRMNTGTEEWRHRTTGKEERK